MTNLFPWSKWFFLFVSLLILALNTGTKCFFLIHESKKKSGLFIDDEKKSKQKQNRLKK